MAINRILEQMDEIYGFSYIDKPGPFQFVRLGQHRLEIEDP